MSPSRDKVAVITDIHGNLPALKAVLANIDERGIERIFCGGDLVGYGPHPNEVCALIAARNIPTIYGNYDYAIARDEEDCGCAYVTQHDRDLGQLSVDWTLANTSAESKQLHARAAVRPALPRRFRGRPPRSRLAPQSQRVPVRGQAGAPVRAPRRRRERLRARVRPHPQTLGARVRRRPVRQLRLGRQAQGRRPACSVRGAHRGRRERRTDDRAGRLRRACRRRRSPRGRAPRRVRRQARCWPHDGARRPWHAACSPSCSARRSWPRS